LHGRLLNRGGTDSCEAWLVVRGHGVADVESGTPVAEDTVFRIASITKTFTAIAVMQLWEQELVDLDAPASDYLRAYRLIPAKSAFRRACGNS
jgi:CubicO group peptidase (beta-lactamase class C family)